MSSYNHYPVTVTKKGKSKILNIISGDEFMAVIEALNSYLKPEKFDKIIKLFQNGEALNYKILRRYSRACGVNFKCRPSIANIRTVIIRG